MNARTSRAPNPRALTIARRVLTAATLALALTVVGSGRFATVPAAAATAPVAAASMTTTLVNGDSHGATIRFDVDGNAIDAHDGEIQRFGDRYYLYGTSYGCGYVRLERPVTPWCGDRVYSSPDLAHWTDEGPLFDATTPYWQSRCNSATLSCYRPHVAYNAATRLYVLWVNTYEVPVHYHVFTSPSPTGPFIERSELPTLALSGGGDMDLFVDDDGVGYLAYTLTGANYDIAVERLDPTYTTGTGAYTRLGVSHTEAPSMFRRGDTYYITLSDPNCAYCAGTGASYLTAPSPLGPWTGAMRGDAPIIDGQLRLADREAISKPGPDWTDYTLDLAVTPLQTGGGGAYAQAGWFFRAQDARNGYAWLIGNYPHPGAEGGNLTKVVYVNGQPRVTIVKLPFPIVGGQRYQVRTEVAGSTFRTWIDGVLVDTTTDTTYPAGRVGLRETTGESGLFDDVTVTAPGGTVLFHDAFDGDTSQWIGLEPRKRGVEISPDSCGGQPADVAVLPAPGGRAYVFQSDRWNHGDQNEALATHYWEPLRFRADGSIEPLTCAASYPLTLAGLKPGTDRAPADLDQSTGSAGFRTFCDTRGALWRAQTFTSSRTGMLSRVAYTSFQDNHPDGPLRIAIADLNADGTPGRVLWSGTRDVTQMSWSPAEVAVAPGTPVTAGRSYAVVVSAPSITRGCYGMAYSPDDPYRGGTALVSTDAGTTWRAEQGRDLKIETSVTPAGPGASA
jgi:hypothetical protein